MKKFVVSIFVSLGALDLGAYYPIIVSSVVAVTFFVTIFLGVFVYRVRRADKTSMLALALAVYTLSAVKIVCDLFTKPIKETFVFSCAGSLFLAAASFAEYGILCLQYNAPETLNLREKRLIDGLSRFNDCFDKGETNGESDEKTNGDFSFEQRLPEQSNIKNAFFETPFKRAEYLQCEKGFERRESDNYGVNFGEILSYIDKARRYDLTTFEKSDLDELETNVQNFSRRFISCAERKKLSSGLSKLAKLLSKYRVS